MFCTVMSYWTEISMGPIIYFTGDPERRMNSREYHLQIGGRRHRVCLKYFLATLGYTSNSVIVEMCKTLGAVTPNFDKRGKHTPSNKIDRSPIEKHIMSFNPQLSHYKREHAPNRRYLPSELSAARMHSLYVEKYPEAKCSGEIYRQTLRKMNINFNEPNQDKCAECMMYKENQTPENNAKLVTH